MKIPNNFLFLKNFIFKINFLKRIKKKLKNNRVFLWNFFHPDKLLSFKYANEAEKVAWNFLKSKMNIYGTICEIGCFNGRNMIINKKFLEDKIYIGYDLNILAIFIAKTLNLIFTKNKNYFYNKDAFFSCSQKSELFISVATLIYFSEFELKNFIKSLKQNQSFKAFIMHEIFIKEDSKNSKDYIKEDNLFIHSIASIEKEFGEDYNINIYRTKYSNWEKKDRISAILCIKKI